MDERERILTNRAWIEALKREPEASTSLFYKPPATQEYPTMYDIVTHALDQAYWEKGEGAYNRIREWWEERGRRERSRQRTGNVTWLK